MDRSHFLITTCLAVALSASLLGCQQNPSGEYRAFTEDQLEKQQTAASEETEAAPTDSGATADASEDANAAGERTNSADVPLLPELAADTDSELASSNDIERSAAPDSPDAAVSDADASDEDTEVSQTPTTARESDPPSSEAVGGAETSPAESSPLESPGDPATVPPSRGGFQLSPEDLAARGLPEPTPGPLQPRDIKLLVPDKTFQVEGPEQAIRVSYDDLDLLKVLNMEPVPEDAASHFPDWLSSLNGEHLRIRGFMYPTFQATDLTGFVLARDNEICCFGRNPKIYDLIEVALREGVTTDYIQGRPFDVVGTLHIRPEWDPDEEKLVRLYQIDDATVINR